MATKKHSKPAGGSRKFRGDKRADDPDHFVNSTLRDRLPFVRRNEGNAAHPVSWWEVSDGEYYHQNQEIGRVFFEEVMRLHPEDPEVIETTLHLALKEMASKGLRGDRGIEDGFLRALVSALFRPMPLQEMRRERA
jgi:hypothetical protein